MPTQTIAISQSALTALQWSALILIFDFVAIIVATICDLISGLRKSSRSGVKPSSRGFRRTVDKLMRYCLTLIALATVDLLVIALLISLCESMGWSLPVAPIFATIGAIAFSAIEIKSVIENSHSRQQLNSAITDTAQTLTKLLEDPAVGRLIEILSKHIHRSQQ